MAGFFVVDRQSNFWQFPYQIANLSLVPYQESDFLSNAKKILLGFLLGFCIFRSSARHQPTPTMKTILHYFFTNGGISLVFRDGSQLFERTPRDMTAFEHLQSLKTSYNF